MADQPGESTAPSGPSAATSFDWLALARGLAGAAVGGIVGYLLFLWLARQGFLAPMAPGVLLGLGAGWAARRRILLLGVVCAVAALGLGIFSEWMRAPFVKDDSFLFFVSNLTKLPNATIKLGGIVLGAAAAFWFGQGR